MKSNLHLSSLSVVFLSDTIFFSNAALASLKFISMFISRGEIRNLVSLNSTSMEVLMVYLDYSSILNNGMSVHVEHRDDGSVISLDGVEWELMGEVPEAVMSVLDDSTQAELLDYIRDSRYDYLMVNHI